MLSTKLPLDLMQTKWASELNPIINNPANNMSLLSNIVLKSGDNVINTTLGKNLQGYIIVMNSAAATFYDKQSSNQHPDLTLILNSSAVTTISLLVF